MHCTSDKLYWHINFAENCLKIDDIGVVIIAMHYGIGWGKTKSIPTTLMGNLVGILFVFPPSNTIMHCDNFNSDIV